MARFVTQVNNESRSTSVITGEIKNISLYCSRVKSKIDFQSF